MSAEQATSGKLTQITAMGTRYLSRWMSWSGTPSTPPGTPSKSSGDGFILPVSPQPPRVTQNRSRASSKVSNISISEKKPYPVVPKLPVPPLGHTLTWYLIHLQSILSDTEFKEVEELVLQFGKPGGIGEKLQEELITKHDQMENWAYQWWLDDMYMKIALPLPVNNNPGMLFPKQEFSSASDKIKFVVKIVIASMEMKEKIFYNELDLDRCTAREKHQPLCMEQYGRVFTSYRRPGIPKDKPISSISASQENQHIMVLIKNHIFTVNTVVNGSKTSYIKLYDTLMSIEHFADNFEDSDPALIGILTSDNRRTWAQTRQVLISDPENKKNIELIEASWLIVCLDDPLPSKFNLTTRTSHRASLSKRGSSFTLKGQNQECLGRDEVNAGLQMIHGGGSLYNSANRWFDKTVQFIFTKDGWCGLCYEHSSAEGIAVIQLVEQVLQNINDDAENGFDFSQPLQPDQHSSLNPADTTRLNWNVGPAMSKRITESAANVDKLIENLDFRVLRYPVYGRKEIKRGKCSPDAYIQMALQLAYFRTQGKLTSTYESASTRRFRLGRVDNIRANTPQVLTWIESMVLNVPMADRLAKFESALKTQVDIMVNNIQGRGIDIHLLGLKEIALEKEIINPEIFEHKSFEESNHFRLSTSQVPTISNSWMGYGPVCPDGYGASYNPHEDIIVFCLSAFKSCEETSTLEFGKNLERALDDMKLILDARAPA